MKSKLFIIHLVSKPIQPATEAKDSVGHKRGAEKATQTSTAGKVCNTCLTLKRSTLKYLKCSQCSYS